MAHLQKQINNNNLPCNKISKSEPTSITNENFSFSPKNKVICVQEKLQNKESAQKSDIGSSLQSPVESHFALTPNANSENSSPANGFTGVICSELLTEELDQLERDALKIEKISLEEKESDSKISISIDNLASPTEENISMFSRCDSNFTLEKEPIGDVINDSFANEKETGEVCIYFITNFLHVFLIKKKRIAVS